MASRPDQIAMTLLGHDLRAALSDMIGGLRLIEPRRLDEPTRLQIERVRAAGEGLARLLEQGLAVMLGEAEAVPTLPPDVDLARFLDDLRMRWSGRAREKAVQFEMRIAPDLPGQMRADLIGLERVMSNLLDNALKHTDFGTVECRVQRHGADRLSFVVADDGPGFSPDALARLFRYEGRPPDAQKPGSGRGLHIAKEMADRMGGTLTVRNRELGGAEVTFTLPLPETSGEAARDRHLGLPDLVGLRVLLADDSATHQIVTSRMLMDMGATVDLASDGTEALARLTQDRFDLALIDIEMPGLSGLEVIRALRRMGVVKGQTPVLAVTAYVLRANREAILAAGANGILSKPVTCPIALGRAILGVLGRLEEVGGVPSGTLDAQAPEVAADMDESRFFRLLDLAGPGTATELLSRLQDDLRTVERALVQALPGPDWDQIRAQTHVLIALAGAVGAIRLQHAASSLNQLAHQRDMKGLQVLDHEVMQMTDALIHFVAGQAEALRRGST